MLVRMETGTSGVRLRIANSPLEADVVLSSAT